MTPRQFFHSHLERDVLIVEIRQPVGSLSADEVMTELDLVIAELKQAPCHHVIIDFCQTAYFGSSLLEALRIIWNSVHAKSGRMILCNVSPIGNEILRVAKFDHLWPISLSRDEALQHLQTPV